MAGVLSCISKPSRNAPLLLRLDAVSQSELFLEEGYGAKESCGRTQKDFTAEPEAPASHQSRQDSS